MTSHEEENDPEAILSVKEAHKNVLDPSSVALARTPFIMALTMRGNSLPRSLLQSPGLTLQTTTSPSSNSAEWPSSRVKKTSRSFVTEYLSPALKLSLLFKVLNIWEADRSGNLAKKWTSSLVNGMPSRPYYAISKLLPSLATITRWGLRCTLGTGVGSLAVFLRRGASRAESKKVDKTLVWRLWKIIHNTYRY